MSDPTSPTPGGRRLTLLPEVLPAPTPARSGKVRERTLDHLRGLLAVAAATTSLSVACSQEPPQATKGSEKPPDDPQHPNVDRREPREDMKGYTVVDMLPPPAMCSGLAASITASASWQHERDQWLVHVVLAKPALSGGALREGSEQSLGGTILRATWSDGGIDLWWLPDPGASKLRVIRISGACNGFAQDVRISINVDANAPRVEHGRVPLRLYDTP